MSPGISARKMSDRRILTISDCRTTALAHTRDDCRLWTCLRLGGSSDRTQMTNTYVETVRDGYSVLTAVCIPIRPFSAGCDPVRLIAVSGVGTPSDPGPLGITYSHYMCHVTRKNRRRPCKPNGKTKLRTCFDRNTTFTDWFRILRKTVCC